LGGYCGAVLCASHDDWSNAVAMREQPIAERLAEVEMPARDREADPRLVIREHLCPTCAGCLVVHVTTGYSDWFPKPMLRALAESS
jgi:acetone carboxylase gamma subunit